MLQAEVNAGIVSNTATVTATSTGGVSLTIPKTWTESIGQDFDFELGEADRRPSSRRALPPQMEVIKTK